MENLKGKRNLVNTVQGLVSNAVWGYEFSGDKGSGVVEACDLLSEKDFSKEEVINMLGEQYEYILEFAKDHNIDSYDDFVKECVRFVSGRLATEFLRGENLVIGEGVTFSVLD